MAGRLRKLSARFRYALAGVLLGLCAPLGAAVLRLAAGATLRHELATYTFFYLYMLIGTALVFATAGYVAGARAERLETERNVFHDLAEHDDLTGLLNARAFFDRYRREMERARRSREPLALLMIDVDYLKRINDEEGHAAGSDALRNVSRALNEVKRASDVAARWGGDEFALLMPGASTSAAQRVADRALEAVKNRTTTAGKRLSVSIGIAVRLTDAGDLFELADAALYRAKEAGRGRSETSPAATDLNASSTEERTVVSSQE